jgi:hypothetical protein
MIHEMLANRDRIVLVRILTPLLPQLRHPRRRHLGGGGAQEKLVGIIENAGL